MDEKIYQLLINIEEKVTSNTMEISKLKIEVEKINNSLLSFDIGSSDKVIKKNIELEFLKTGFNLDEEFTKDCFVRNSSIADLELLNTYYKQKDIIFPIKKEGKNFLYYKENDWLLDNENYITNTLIDNLVNSYLTILMKEDNFLAADYKRNLSYAHKIQNSNLYKKKLIKEFLRLLYND